MRETRDLPSSANSEDIFERVGPENRGVELFHKLGDLSKTARKALDEEGSIAAFDW